MKIVSEIKILEKLDLEQLESKCTKEDKFEILLRNIRDHHFLHYYPYLLEDNVIIEDAEKRAQNFEKHPNTIIDLLNQCCCICYIGSIKKEENPYTTNGDVVEYNVLPIKFYNNKKCQEIVINKSDFNPRQYLTVCGFVNVNSDPFFREYSEKYGSKIGKWIKTSSLVNDESEIERYQNSTVLMTYSIPVMSGFGSFRSAYRLYSIGDDCTKDYYAKIIREQILRTQQYILCTIINFPQLITSEKDFFNQEIFDKYLPTFKQMYDMVCAEIKERKIESIVKETYLPTFLQNIEDYFLPKDNYLCESISEEMEDYRISKYAGFFAIRDFDCCPISELLDRNGVVFKPSFRNSVDYIEDSDYCEISFEQIDNGQLIVCYANEVDLNARGESDYDEFEDEDNNDFGYDEYYGHEFYFDQDEEVVDKNNYYLGLMDKYGHVFFELRSLSSFLNKYEPKFGFKAYNSNYVIIYLTNSYNFETKCYAKCGVIDVKKGIIILPLIFTEIEVMDKLLYGGNLEDDRYYGSNWCVSYYDEGCYFNGPIYLKESDILEQGRYAGHTIKDALHFYGKEIITELIFENKIFIADTALPKNIAHFSSIERSLKRYQDKHLEFNEITDINDEIFAYSAFHRYREDVVFGPLYEGKTLEEAIAEKGMFYIKDMVESGVLKISEDVICELVDKNADLYLPLQEAYYSFLRKLEVER